VLANELCLSVNKNPDVFYVHAKRVKLECSIQTTAPLSETFAFRVGQQKLKHHFFLFQRKKNVRLSHRPSNTDDDTKR
jgi:hypothetical protein